MRDTIAEHVEEKLRVPGLIGPNQAYSSLTSYLLQVNKKIENDIPSLQEKSTELQSQITSLEAEIEKEAKIIVRNKSS